MAVAAPGRRADRDEHRLGAVHRVGQVVGEREPAGGDVLCHQLVQARLVDRHAALMQRGELLGVGLHNGDVDAELGEAGAGDQADIAAADHRNTHVCRSLR